MAATRIYVVTQAVGEQPEHKATRLVEASTQAQAITTVVRSSITCRVASQQDLVELVKAGVPVEKAGA